MSAPLPRNEDEKHMKKLVSLLLVLIVAVSLSLPAFAQETKQPAGYITLSLEASSLGLGFIEEPQKVPFYEGENVAQVTARYFEQNGREYSATGTPEEGFNLASVKTDWTEEEQAALLNIPQFILDIYGMTQEEYIEEGSKGDYKLGQGSYGMFAGWMFSTASTKGLPSVGASEILAQNGDVVRWQFTLENFGADLGYDAGWGIEPDYLQADQDALVAVLGAINSASDKDKILAQHSTLRETFDNAMDAVTLLTLPQGGVNNFTQILGNVTGIGYDYIAAAGETATTVAGITVIPGQPALPIEGVSITLPQKIEGAQGTEFNAVVQVGSWTEDTLKLIDGVFSVPAGLEVTGVEMGSQFTGGEVNYNLAEGKLRFAYMDGNLGDVALNATTFPAELMTITFRFTEEISEDAKLAIVADNISLRTGSDTQGVQLDVSESQGEVDAIVPVPVVVPTSRVIYTGDGTDLIEEGQQAVAVEFLNLPESSKVMFGETELLYSAEITAKKGVTTYVAITDTTVSTAQLDDIASYTITQEAHGSVTFADTNEDGVINAQDSLNTLSLWLRETPLESDAQILTSNVNADGAINTVDVLAIMELFVNARELDIVSK